MPYDESFAPETEVLEVEPVEAATQVAETTAEPTTATTEAAAEQAESTETEASAAETQEPTTEATTEATTAETAPAFDESAYLKTVLGDKAPATAAELKQQYDALAAKQLTPEQEAQLALLRDPAKLAEYAKLATKDYDALDSIGNMREQFARENPDMSESQRERRFQRQFAEKYPTLAAAIANPSDYAADDPALLEEKEDADYDALASRAANKLAQTERTNQFIASQAAASGPQLTAEQLTDSKVLPAWLDEVYKEGATIPVDAGDGNKFTLPIGDPAAFKAAFVNPYELLDNLTLTKPIAEGGIINREKLALVTAILQNPVAFVQNIAKQARLAQPEPEASIPVNTLTNSSAAKRPPATKAPVTAATTGGESNQPMYVDADAWQNSNA